jgi:polar amino acid transport system permease protein
MQRFLKPHRLVMLAIGAAIVIACAINMNWSWIPEYSSRLLQGIWVTIWLTILTMGLGMILAVMLGIAQAAGPFWLAAPARAYCSVIRGTPLLLQLWLLYFGLGSFFPQFPWIRESELWPILRQAWPYAVLALTLSVAGYEGEVMRGAFKGVPSGQLEAARAMGMPRFTAFRRIWLPQALHRALPTIAGETVLQMKATPLVATITVVDTYSVAKRVTQDTFIVYEPLLLLAVIYILLTSGIVLFYRWLERRIPSRVA